jgi:hypothetical protein
MGVISVKCEAEGRPQLHFKFGTASEYMEGVVKQKMGIPAFSEMNMEMATGIRLHCAMVCHKENNLADADDTLDLLDYVSDADRKKVLEVANSSMGFIRASIIEIVEAIQKQNRPKETIGSVGKSVGKKEKPLRSVG